jgi:hypothetical protein
LKSLSLVLLTALHIQIALAQTDSLRSRVNYFNMFASGALMGCGQCNNGKDFTLSITTVHGIGFKSGIKVSLGTGLDTYYNWRMIPLLAGFTLDKGVRQNSFFLQLNSGYSFGRFLEIESFDGVTLDQRGGFIFNPMVGYRIGNEKVRLYVLTGYKYQNARIDFSSMWGWPHSYSREYDLSRVVIQLGFGIN